jgi:hypothetical protein
MVKVRFGVLITRHVLATTRQHLDKDLYTAWLSHSRPCAPLGGWSAIPRRLKVLIPCDIRGIFRSTY